MDAECGDDDAVKSLEMLAGGNELSPGRKGTASEGIPRHTSLFPAGHLPLKGGDRPEARSHPTKNLEIAERLPNSAPCRLPAYQLQRDAERATFYPPPGGGDVRRDREGELAST